ncbi:MAG: hypothetical protein KC468_23920, partial [Myxococcales bacterium]|nr:hypothetical protein [Myxococcales bacterium]
MISETNVGDPRLAPEFEELTVMFSEIRGFTSVSERMTPAENFAFINEYLQAIAPCILSDICVAVRGSAYTSSRVHSQTRDSYGT